LIRKGLVSLSEHQSGIKIRAKPGTGQYISQNLRNILAAAKYSGHAVLRWPACALGFGLFALFYTGINEIVKPGTLSSLGRRRGMDAGSSPA
jgi:hypothetical protein